MMPFSKCDQFFVHQKIPLVGLVLTKTIDGRCGYQTIVPFLCPFSHLTCSLSCTLSSCCASRFTWASTCDSEAQEARDKHNCRSCGALVCHPCSKQRIPLPSIGLNVSSRVCDRCYYNDVDVAPERKKVEITGGTAVVGSTVRSDKVLREDMKPIRNRAKRSPVVDELASRIQATQF
jgi:FYVE zinc finger